MRNRTKYLHAFMSWLKQNFACEHMDFGVQYRRWEEYPRCAGCGKPLRDQMERYHG